ncbi:MAG TPA: flagellar biosynthetic protein FliR, partial [Chlamydiales bacterium]|nr:flagellar biosynthetic protein FliR [Chlamydiales bacterium]
LSPAPARIGIAIILTLVFMPTIIHSSNLAITFNAAMIGYALKEFVIGFFIAFLAMIPFLIANTAGLLIDYMRGASMMQMQDPNLQSQTSPIGQLYNYVLILIFFVVGGPFFFFDAIQQSFQFMPVDAWLKLGAFSQHTPLFKLLVDVVNQVMTIAIQLGAPAILAILMTEVFLGIANRLAQQVQIAFLGMSLKSLAALTLLWAGWFFTLKVLSKQTLDWFKMIDNILYTLKIH